jgi:ABC-type dipeptide/oligopeptide/nickel transport system permease subunit
MKTYDFSIYIVSYNFIVGVLLMLASEKIGVYAGHFTGAFKQRISRLTRIGVLTFGACIVVVCLIAYVGGHLLRL